LYKAYKQTGAYWIESLNVPQIDPEIEMPAETTPVMPPFPPGMISIPTPYPNPVRQ
jgi:hypothetical protein